MKRERDGFMVTGVHRDDLIGIGFDGDAVDDVTMEHLARLMCNGYVENCFGNKWKSMQKN